jgi:hypothetical protein
MSEEVDVLGLEASRSTVGALGRWIGSSGLAPMGTLYSRLSCVYSTFM